MPPFRRNFASVSPLRIVTGSTLRPATEMNSVSSPLSGHGVNTDSSSDQRYTVESSSPLPMPTTFGSYTMTCAGIGEG